MDLSYPPEAEEFRVEIKAGCTTTCPTAGSTTGFEMTDDERKQFNEEWPQKLFEGGWICATWPAEYGGKGLTTMQGVVLSEEFANAKAPMRGDFFGDTLVGPDHPAVGHRGAEEGVPARHPLAAPRAGARASPSPTRAPTSPR